MKIVEITCKGCKAKYEALDGLVLEGLSCPACGSTELEIKKTDREFTGCGGSCGDCSSCK